jgi:pilus assembly protein CpaB
MAVSSLTPARALRQPRRLDARAVVGLFLLLLAVAGSLAFWRSANDTQAVLVATRDRPAGATLAPGDLAVAHLRLDDAVYAAAVPAEQLASLVGRQLAEPVHARQLLVPAQVSTRPRLGPDQVALTIPVAPQTAVGGQLRPGDHVRVIATRDRGRPESRTEVVLGRALVYDVGRDDRGAVLGGVGDEGERARSGPLSSATLVVSQEEAVRLAHARWNGDLDVALLPPEPA